jgi:hypothetical protein
MNPSTEELENLLRHAPVPAPPAGLKDRLVADLPVAGFPSQANPAPGLGSPGNWLRRWWPALAPATVSLACAAVLGLQQMEIRDLKHMLQTLAPSAPVSEVVAAGENSGAVARLGTTSTGPEEIERLKALTARLSSEVAQLEELRSENQKLRAQLTASSNAGFTAEEEQALADARARAERIQCCNNMKQLGLAVRVYALDNTNMTPPDVICISNEVSAMKVLVCPSDTAHQVAASWFSATPANCSYDYLAPNAPADTEPNRVLFRCPIHGTIGLCDGSVQSGVAKSHPESLVQRDGKLYFESSPAGEAPKSPPN